MKKLFIFMMLLIVSTSIIAQDLKHVDGYKPLEYSFEYSMVKTDSFSYETGKIVIFENLITINDIKYQITNVDFKNNLIFFQTKEDVEFIAIIEFDEIINKIIMQIPPKNKTKTFYQ